MAPHSGGAYRRIRAQRHLSFRSGEPRESFKHATALRAKGLPAGDCVDCGQCVAVCPTGVDIRQGASLGCIQCGLCIDACDSVMEKVGRPPRLIAYDTEMNIKARACGQPSIYKPIRVRTVFYAVLILAIGGFMIYTLATRDNLHLNVLHDRNPLTVRLSDGGVRNAYTIRISNMKPETRRFALDIVGVQGAQVEVVGGRQGRARPLHRRGWCGPDARGSRAVRRCTGSTPTRLRSPLTSPRMKSTRTRAFPPRMCSCGRNGH